MRQWMVDPKILCRKHLLGEHVEHHMFVGSIQKGKTMTGFLSGNLLEPSSLRARHAALANEIERRGYNHHSPLPEFLPTGHEHVMIDREASLTELLRRCPDCRQRHGEEHGML